MSEAKRPPRPGTELKRLLNTPVSADCLCNDRAKFMDIMGVAWCKQHNHELAVPDIVDWLQEEHERRFAIYREAIEELKTADADRREQLHDKIAALGITKKIPLINTPVVIPFVRTVARRLISLAIARAEKGK